MLKISKLPALKLKYVSFLESTKKERISWFLVSLYFIHYGLLAHLVMSGLKLSFKNSGVTICFWNEITDEGFSIYFFAIKVLSFWVSFRKLPSSSPSSCIYNWSLYLWGTHILYNVKTVNVKYKHCLKILKIHVKQEREGGTQIQTKS